MTNLILTALIIVVLLSIIITDYKKHEIYNISILLLIGAGAARIHNQEGIRHVLIGLAFMFAVYIVCLLIGYIYYKKKNFDIAGGGDYKLVAALLLALGPAWLAFALFAQFIYEALYRYILFPRRKNDALPLGASLGVFSILALVLEVFI